MSRFPLIALLLSIPMLAHAADQTILGNALTVKSPADAAKRKIIFKAKEAASPNTIVGDPIANGATLELSINGTGYEGTPHTQSFNLPTGTSSQVESERSPQSLGSP